MCAPLADLLAIDLARDNAERAALYARRSAAGPHTRPDASGDDNAAADDRAAFWMEFDTQW